jgi:hypothetical protein
MSKLEWDELGWSIRFELGEMSPEAQVREERLMDKSWESNPQKYNELLEWGARFREKRAKAVREQTSVG